MIGDADGDLSAASGVGGTGRDDLVIGDGNGGDIVVQSSYNSSFSSSSLLNLLNNSIIMHLSRYNVSLKCLQKIEIT
jgi:hypothetical protein